MYMYIENGRLLEIIANGNKLCVIRGLTFFIHHTVAL